MKIKTTMLVIGLFVSGYYLITATNSFTIINDIKPEAVISNDCCEVDYTGIPFMKKIEDLPVEIKTFEISAYNTVSWQTDDSPCISASGKNICGRDDVIACPARFKFGSRMQIKNKIYVCEDRMKNDGAIDISFDKDIAGARNWGRKVLAVRIIK